MKQHAGIVIVQPIIAIHHNELQYPLMTVIKLDSN